jgi:hypothetical protein
MSPLQRTRRHPARWLAIALAGALLAVGFVATAPEAEPAQAADLSGFDPGMIISDGVFYNSSTMSAAAIKSWLGSKDPGCSTHTSGGVRYTCLADFSMKTVTKPATENCHVYTGHSSESAATIIYKVARACGINPQVILVTLQKEQGFITGGPRSSGIYRKAMGMGCPDTASCSSKYYGFFNQVFAAAYQFKQYKNHPVRTYQAGRTNTIKYHPNSKCGTKRVVIRNQATAGLYNYTPYVPNAHLLQRHPDACSSYGNLNFYTYFSDWFGAPSNQLRNFGFETAPGTKYWHAGSSGGLTVSAYNSSTVAHTGKRVARIKASKDGALLKQTISYKTKVSGIYNAAVWVKSSSDTPITGSLIAQTGGGTAESVTVPFTAGATWTQVSGTLNVAHSKHTSVALIVKLNTTGHYLFADDAEFSFTGVTPPPRVAMTKNSVYNPGFEAYPATLAWAKSDDDTTKIVGVGSKSLSHAGAKHVEIVANTAGDRMKQTIYYDALPGESYTAKIWVRAATGGEEVPGKLYLYAAGGPLEQASTAFTANSTAWQQVTVTLPVSKTGHTELRFVVQVDSTRQYLRVDDADLRLTAP